MTTSTASQHACVTMCKEQQTDLDQELNASEQTSFAFRNLIERPVCLSSSQWHVQMSDALLLCLRKLVLVRYKYEYCSEQRMPPYVKEIVPPTGCTVTMAYRYDSCKSWRAAPSRGTAQPDELQRRLPACLKRRLLLSTDYHLALVGF
eukprot:scaffold42925_cov36-Prasinocladus_malaysianus.AAC.1